jgi:hypothetical protein
MNDHDTNWREQPRDIYLRPDAKLYLRPDPKLYLRHDAHRFTRPSGLGDGAHRPGVVEWTGKRGRWLPENDSINSVERQRREAASQLRALLDLKAEILKLHSDLAFERFKRTYSRWAHEQELRRKAGFRPDQLRVPAGNPDGGQWTAEGGGINDPRVLSDAIPDPIRPGAQYASSASRGGSRPPMGRFSGTPRQEAELQATKVRADRALNAVQRIDPNWRPEPILETPRTIENVIRYQRDLALEAEGHFEYPLSPEYHAGDVTPE